MLNLAQTSGPVPGEAWVAVPRGGAGRRAEGALCKRGAEQCAVIVHA